MKGAADGHAGMVISLDAGSVKSEGAAAGKSIRGLKGELESAQRALAESRKSLALLAAGGKHTTEQQKALRDAIKVQRAKVAELGSSYLSAGGKASELGKATQAATSSGSAFAGVLQLKKAAALGAALAVWGAVAAVNAYAAKLGDARRNELLHLEGLTKMRFWYGAVRGSATEMQGAIDRVSASSAQSRGEVLGLAESLYRAGLRGKGMEQALEAASIVAVTQGQEMARAFVGQAAGAALAGASVERMSATVKARLGGLAQKHALSLGVQFRKLGESFEALFRGVNVEPVLRALDSVFSLLRPGQAVAEALSTTFSALFGAAFGGAEGAGKLVRRVIQGATIAMLQMVIVGLKVRNWLREMWPSDWLGKTSAASAALTAGKVAAYALAGGLALLVGLGTVGLALLAAGTAALVGPIVGIGVAMWKAWGLVKEGFAWVQALDWGALGTAIVDGIVGGIKRGASAAVQAVKSLALDAKRAFAETLGIHSPSRVFAAFGGNLAAGVEVGARREAPRARRAVAEIVEAPWPRRGRELGASWGAGLRVGAAPRASSEPSRSGGPLVVIENLTIQGGDANWAQRTREELIRILESVVAEVGGRYAV